VIVFDERSLRRILASYVDYYHRSRTHLSLGKDSPRSTTGSAARNRARRGGASGRRTASPLRAPRRLNPPKVPPATRERRQDRVCRCGSSFTLALWALRISFSTRTFPNRTANIWLLVEWQRLTNCWFEIFGRHTQSPPRCRQGSADVPYFPMPTYGPEQFPVSPLSAGTLFREYESKPANSRCILCLQQVNSFRAWSEEKK
jgi:hypothetical protein